MVKFLVEHCFFFFGCEQFLVMWVLVVEFFFWTCDFFCMEFLDMWVAAWEFFFFLLACDLSWNDELNCCVAEPQESR